jgi:hypothetical protein
MRKIVFILVLIGLTSFTLGLVDKALANPAGQSYDIWVSQSFGAPPFVPFHDCLRFNAAGTSLGIDGCPPAGPAVVQAGPIGDFIGLSCGGNLDLLLLGKHLNGTEIGFQADALGGVIAGLAESTTFGFEGLANPNCTPGAAAEGNPWSSE